jgi:hypothetical protein
VVVTVGIPVQVVTAAAAAVAVGVVGKDPEVGRVLVRRYPTVKNKDKKV